MFQTTGHLTSQCILTIIGRDRFWHGSILITTHSRLYGISFVVVVVVFLFF